MKRSQINSLIVVLLSTLLVVLGVKLVSGFVQGDQTLIRSMALSHSIITPNADGSDDITTLSYELARNATVSIYLDAQESGERYYFRKDKPRSAQIYDVQFSGIVDGYLRDGEQFDGAVLSRLVPDGLYAFTIDATDELSTTMVFTQPLLIQNGDAELPIIQSFDVVPTTFTDDWHEDAPVPFSPNRDGLGDRLDISLFINKDVNILRVYLEMEDGARFPAVEMESNIPRLGRGSHAFDYSGGIDEGALPPADGLYDLVAYAEDLEGQKFRTVRQIEVRTSGLPRTEFVSPANGETLRLNATTLELCDTLTFSVTVRNYGTAPIRTSGPPPGTVYDSDWNYNTLGWYEEAGVFRVAIGHETEHRNYAYRWGLGTADNLTQIGDQLYLMPGEQVVVSGGIRITEKLSTRKTQPFWAGLIHEQVRIAQFNNRKDPQTITLELPPEGMTVTCDAREIPVREAIADDG